MNRQRGFFLELDGSCDTLKLAFKYDGIQHYRYINPFYRTYKEFVNQMRLRITSVKKRSDSHKIKI